MPGCCRPAVWSHVAARRAVAVALPWSAGHIARICSGFGQCCSRALASMDPGSDVRVKDFLGSHQT